MSNDYDEYMRGSRQRKIEKEEKMRKMKILPDLYIEENEMIDAIETTSLLLGYDLRKYETRSYREIRVIRINSKNERIKIILTYNFKSKSMIFACKKFNGPAKDSLIYGSDTYGGKSYIELIKDFLKLVVEEDIV